MKKYEVYKESGVDWMGKIPKDWHLLKIGRTFSNIGSGTTPKSTNAKFYENGNINWLNTGDLNDDYIHSTKKKITSDAIESSTTLKLHPKESVVIALYGATIGKLGFLKIKSTTNQACCVLSNSDKVIQRFLFYYFLGAREFIISKSYGGGQPNISQELIKQLYIASPTIKEQTQIAKYLDHKTQIIDALIGKKEELIKKLQAQRQAVINEAVTKGLNKNAKLKDSGIEWLGEIPEHWEVMKLKYLGSSITGITYSPNDVSENGILVLRSSNIQNGKLDLKDTIYVSKSISEKYVTRKDDILLCSRNGSRNLIDKNILIDERAENQSWGAFMTIYRSDYNDFMYYFFNSDIFSGMSSLFLSSTINQLTIGVINNMQIAFPKDENERKAIITALKIQTEKLNEVIELNRGQIKKLKSYRQSIISEAVTGKIDVRDWQIKI